MSHRKRKMVKPILQMNKTKLLIAYQSKSLRQIAREWGFDKSALQRQFKRWGIDVKKADGLKKTWERKYRKEALRLLAEKKNLTHVLCSVTNYIVPSTQCENCQLRECLQRIMGGNFICFNAKVNFDLGVIRRYNESRKDLNENFYKEAKDNAREDKAEDNANNS